jgi:hypothetical protein
MDWFFCENKTMCLFKPYIGVFLFLGDVAHSGRRREGGYLTVLFSVGFMLLF